MSTWRLAQKGLTEVAFRASSVFATQGCTFPTEAIVHPISVPFISQPSLGIYALAVARVRSFVSFGKGWDGYGAASIKPATISNAVRLLEAFRLPTALGTPFVAPHPNGTITLEWESPFGDAYLEIGQTRYSFYAKPTVGEAILLEGATDMVRIDLMASTITRIVFPILSSSNSVYSITRVNGPSAE